MTVTATTRKAGPYAGTGALTAFSFAFKVFTKEDITVTVADSTGLETVKVLDSDYSVTLNADQSVSPGGSVTYPISGTALPSGSSLVITGGMALEQTADLPGGGAFNADVVEAALDRCVILLQQLQELYTRTLALAASVGADVSAVLPAPVAGALLGWNATGKALTNISGFADAPVSSFMTPVVAASSQANAQTALGLGAGDTPTFADVKLTTGTLSGFRNRIINGAFTVDQYNGGSAQTIVAGAALAYCIDRWFGYCAGANVSFQRVAGSGASQYRARFTGAASVTTIGFGTRLEGVNVNDVNNDNVTLSVDLANSLLTSVTWSLYYSSASDVFGTLAVPLKTYISSGTFTVNATPTRYSATVAVPPAAFGRGLELVLSVGAQTSGTWDIGQVQIERGSTATTFEQRPYPLELGMCQRYSYTVDTSAGVGVGYFGSGHVESATQAFVVVPLPVPMRATPTGVTVTASDIHVNAAGSVVASIGVSIGVGQGSSAAIALSISVASGLTTGRGTTAYLASGKRMRFTGAEL